MSKFLAAFLAFAVTSASAFAGPVEIVSATAQKDGAARYSFSVTLRHADAGWDHYANEWRVLSADGTVLGTRTLHHPHVQEQPFTRSLGGVAVPVGIKSVIIDARDSKHGRTKKVFALALPKG